MPPAAVIGGMALAGGIAGAMGSKTEQKSTSGVNVGGATGEELAGQKGMMDAFSQLQGMVGAGPGQSDVSAGYGSQKDLASMLDAYSKGGYNPSAQDISSSNTLAGQLFQGQRTALNQNFSDQTIAANRQAALMGRDPNDPILRNKLAQEQTRQSQQLDANQGAFATQYALQQPMQRLDFAQQRTGILSGLATQAMANRQAIASMGEGIMNNERNWRLQTAQHYGDTTQTSGGGLGGAITGALGGAGAGMGMAGGMAGMNLSNALAQKVAGASPAQFFGGGAYAPAGGFNGNPGMNMFPQPQNFYGGGGGANMAQSLAARGGYPTMGGSSGVSGNW